MPSLTLKTFRAQFNLPETFGIQNFETKDYVGLAKMDSAGAELNQLRDALLEIIPPHLSIAMMMPFLDTLREVFRTGLIGINSKIGLTIEQLEFAVAGFGDVCQTWGYALIHAKMSKQEMPLFHNVYRIWVQDSERTATEVHTYTHEQNVWHIQIVHTVYGRVGLYIVTPTEEFRVLDTLYACPAEGFMATLLGEIAEKLKTSLA